MKIACKRDYFYVVKLLINKNYIPNTVQANSETSCSARFFE